MDHTQAQARFGAGLDPDAKSFLWLEVSKPEGSPIEFLDLVVRTNNEKLVHQSFPIDEGTHGQLLGLSMSKDEILALKADRQIVPKGERLEVSIDLKCVSPVQQPGPETPVPAVTPPPAPSSNASASANSGSPSRQYIIQPGAESYAHGQIEQARAAARKHYEKI
jgi:hypothetical protein